MFAGFPVAALDFYDDLELDNTKLFWTAHKPVYDEAVKAPMAALSATLEPEFGTAKVFRPYRDVRFSKDKAPYKTHQGAFVPTGPATGYYLQLSAAGVMVGGGFYEATSERIGAIRDAIVDERTGRALEALLRRLRDAGWEVGGERLRTSPRGYDGAHPRIELLRHKQLVVHRDYGFDPVIHSPDLVDRVRGDWRALGPLVDWLGDATRGL